MKVPPTRDVSASKKRTEAKLKTDAASVVAVKLIKGNSAVINNIINGRKIGKEILKQSQACVTNVTENKLKGKSNGKDEYVAGKTGAKSSKANSHGRDASVFTMIERGNGHLSNSKRSDVSGAATVSNKRKMKHSPSKELKKHAPRVKKQDLVNNNSSVNNIKQKGGNTNIIADRNKKKRGMEDKTKHINTSRQNFTTTTSETDTSTSTSTSTAAASTTINQNIENDNYIVNKEDSDTAIQRKKNNRRPPSDLKRLALNQAYKVMSVSRWGSQTTMTLSDLSGKLVHDGISFKPPRRYSGTEIKVGYTIRVTKVGYSKSRNKVAKDFEVQDCLGKTIQKTENKPIVTNEQGAQYPQMGMQPMYIQPAMDPSMFGAGGGFYPSYNMVPYPQTVQMPPAMIYQQPQQQPTQPQPQPQPRQQPRQQPQPQPQQQQQQQQHMAFHSHIHLQQQQQQQQMQMPFAVQVQQAPTRQQGPVSVTTVPSQQTQQRQLTRLQQHPQSSMTQLRLMQQQQQQQYQQLQVRQQTPMGAYARFFSSAQQPPTQVMSAAPRILDSKYSSLHDKGKVKFVNSLGWDRKMKIKAEPNSIVNTKASARSGLSIMQQEQLRSIPATIQHPAVAIQGQNLVANGTRAIVKTEIAPRLSK